MKIIGSLFTLVILLSACDGCRDCEVEHFGETISLEVCKKDYDSKDDWKAWMDTLENRGGKCSKY